MTRKSFITYIGLDILFLLCAGLHLFIPLFTRTTSHKELTLRNVASTLLLNQCPLTSSMINAGLMIVSFLVSLPTLIFRRNIILLQVHAWLIAACALFTLGIGLRIWFLTLQTRANLAPVWAGQDTLTQSALQFKFECCGYYGTSDFIQDGTCNATSAPLLGSCVAPFSAFANGFLDIVFTTFFGFCTIDVMLLLSVLCVIQERKEEKRYALIDEKKRGGGI